MSNYGVTLQGFRKKRLDEIKQEIESDISINLGVPINTAPDSVFAQLIAPFSDKVAELWDVGEDTYHSMYPNSSEGVSLDNAISLAGVGRKKAAKTKIYISCLGIDNTILPTGSKVRRTQGKIEYFSSYTNEKISLESARGVNLKVKTVADNTSYYIILDGKVYSFKSGIGALEADILNGLKQAITDIVWITSINEGVMTIDRADKSGSHSITFSSNLIAESVISNILFSADEYGPINPPVGTVNEIITPYDGWISCSNDLPAVIGQNAESDIEVRQTYASRVPARGKAAIEAIRGAILQYVQGVNECYVFENPSHTVDEEGRPPHSIEVVVEGGEDIDVAQEIFNTKTGGAPLVGTVEVVVKDSSGIDHTIRFNRTQKDNAWVKVVASAIPGKALSNDAVSQIITAILNETSNYYMGMDIPVQSFFGAVYAAVKNLGSLSISMAISENAPLEASYVSDVLNLAPRQKAVFSPDRIEVLIQ